MVSQTLCEDSEYECVYDCVLSVWVCVSVCGHGVRLTGSVCIIKCDSVCMSVMSGDLCTSVVKYSRRIYKKGLCCMSGIYLEKIPFACCVRVSLHFHLSTSPV